MRIVRTTRVFANMSELILVSQTWHIHQSILV